MQIPYLALYNLTQFIECSCDLYKKNRPKKRVFVVCDVVMI